MSHDVPDGLVRFGDVARGRCGMQAQYCSRYVDGRHGFANLGQGLRFRALRPTADGDVTLDPSDYRCILIHRDDVDEFVRRVAEEREWHR